MRIPLGLILAGTFLLSSCAFPELNGPAKRKSTAVRTEATSTPRVPDEEPAASGTVVATPSPSPTPTATPAVPMRILSGLVKIDASYVIAAGAGNVISAGSGNVISAGAGNVISAGSGNVISGGAGHVISAGSGNVISAGSGNFRLFDLASVPYGTVLPVSGMVVVPISLTSGKPIGEAVRTDETGKYSVSVPESISENVLVYGAMPAASETDTKILTDPRLRFGAIVQPTKTQTADLTEDSTMATRYMLLVFVNYMQAFLDAEDSEAVINTHVGGSLAELPPALHASLVANLKTIVAAAKAKGYTSLSAADKRRMIHRMTDSIAADMNPDDMKLAETDFSPSMPYKPPLPTVSAVEVLQGILKGVREKAAPLLQANPAHFDAMDFIAEENARRTERGEAAFRVLRPSDLAEFIVTVSLGRFAPPRSTNSEQANRVLEVVGADWSYGVAGDESTRYLTHQMVHACSAAVMRKVGMVLLTSTSTVTDSLETFEPED